MTIASQDISEYNVDVVRIEDSPVKARGVFCSCVQTVRTFIPSLPKGDAQDFKPNSAPFVGVAVLFEYSNSVSHIAYMSGIEPDGFWVKEGNHTPCEYGERFVRWNDPFITGFYNPAIDVLSK